MDAIELQHVQHLEQLCQQLYTGSDPVQRLSAEKQLVQFQTGALISPTATAGASGTNNQTSPASNPPASAVAAVGEAGAVSAAGVTLTRCQLLLQRAESPYAQLLAATTLTRLVSRNCPSVTPAQRLDIRNYVLNYLATRPKMASFVVQALVTLFGRLTKLGWFDTSKDELAFKNVIKDITVFLQGSVDHCMIGVQILSQLTMEMNTVSEPDVVRWLSRHRKIAASFRDMCLYDVFRLGCSLLRTALENQQSLRYNTADESQNGLMTHLLKLCQNCLVFDFMGTYSDESSDDLSTVQIPISWRPAFLDPATIKLFFDLYSTLPHSISSLSLACLVQIASVRRSLFNNQERSKFLNNMVQGVKGILQSPQGLTDADNYHEFCRLLARLKSNYQLGELVMVEGYPVVIQLIAKFTVQSLQMWQFAPNSIHYLLSLWQRMVASVPYVKAIEPHLLETYTPEVTKAYITSRLESAAITVRDRLEDPLDDLGQVQQQLDQISTIGRCDYNATCRLLIALFDETAQGFQQALHSGNTADLLVKQNQLTWLVYLIGSAIGGRVSFNVSGDHDTMDGQLICLVLQLMNLTDSQLHQAAGCEKLELATISFFEQFRKIYVGEQVHKTAKVYSRLSEVLGISDDVAVLSVFMRKIITNLKYWSSSVTIISRTLQLLSELSVGYSSVRRLIKLDEVQFLLNNHTSEQFPLLGSGVAVSELRCRTVLYTALGRLLMVELGEDGEKFANFMQPLTVAFNAVGNAMTTDANVYQNEDTKKALIGLSRDLRGLALAFNTKQSYLLLFEWVYPTYTSLLVRAVELWFSEPALTSPVLKLFSELTLNRSQRLLFDSLSPGGVLLFREVSKLLCTYGERILTVTDVPEEHVYALRLKGVCICFAMLKSALCGNFVNFGVFRLYGDEALDNALRTFVKLMLSTSLTDLLHYPKLSQSYYILLECLCQDHMAFLTSLEPQVFLYIFSTISEGLQSLDTMVCTGCCTALDYIVTFTFKQLSQKGKKKSGVVSGQSGGPLLIGGGVGGDAVLQILEHQSSVLQQLLATILNIVMYEDCRNQWSMSRPLLGLILLNEEYFGQLREQLIQSSRQERQVTVRQAFTKLMEGVEANLQSKNRDQFTQNLTSFRRDVNDDTKTSGATPGGNTCNDLAMTSAMGDATW